MRISFVVSFLEPTGGHIAVLEIGARLARRGHEVRVVYPRRSILSRRNDLLRRLGPLAPASAFRTNTRGLDWFAFPGEVVEVQELGRSAFPPGDAVVATAWRTAEYVARLPREAGRPCYFIQHYETWSGPADRVDATWRLPFTRIVSAAWLADLARDKFGIDDVPVVPYGVDLERFRPDPAAEARRTGRRVGFLYHPEPWKGVGDALAAATLASAETEPIELEGFGLFPRGADLPDEVEYRFRPTREELPAFYSSLDVFLCASWSETGPMTIPEAMACGTAVVSTAVGNVPLWTEGGAGAFLAPPRDVPALGEALRMALANPQERLRRAERGRDAIGSWTWERAADAFERILEEAA